MTAGDGEDAASVPTTERSGACAGALGVRSLAPFAAIAAVYTVSITILATGTAAQGPAVWSAGVAVDLTVTTPLVVWWLGVRRAGWPRWTIAAAFGAGLFVGRMFLPSSAVVTVLIAGWIAAEAVIAAFAFTRIRRIVRAARAHDGPGPVAKLEAGLVAAGAPLRVAAIVATDAVALWLGLTGWFRRAPRDGFAMHRRKSWALIVGVFLALIVLETVGLHLVLSSWSPVVAWVLTGLSIYGFLWIAAQLHAVRLYPPRVTRDGLAGAIGLHWRFAIPRRLIASVELIDAVPDGALNASLVEPTVLIRLTEPIEVRGLFGMRRTPTAIALTIDEPERLIAELARDVR